MEDNSKYAGQIFDSIRIVHTNELWDEEVGNWCNISVFDCKTNDLIASGRGVLKFYGKSFFMETKLNVEGFICCGANFKMPEAMYYNCLEIEVM